MNKGKKELGTEHTSRLISKKEKPKWESELKI